MSNILVISSLIYQLQIQSTKQLRVYIVAYFENQDYPHKPLREYLEWHSKQIWRERMLRGIMLNMMVREIKIIDQRPSLQLSVLQCNLQVLYKECLIALGAEFPSIFPKNW